MKLLVLLLWALGGLSAEARVSKMSVLARVADQVITDRRVRLNLFVDKPALYLAGGRDQTLAPDQIEQGLQRTIAQLMVTEENRIVGLVQVSDAEVDVEQANLKRELGAKYAQFMADFELGERDLRPLLRERVLLRKGLLARVKEASAKADKAGGAKPETAQLAIDEWLKQLRARYRVQRFKDMARERTE
ncbi:MAG: hypothetical protein JST16_13785 [Bdellovibrionales bacterium]|nr:hypothetical protein [Bdellovibrionales bacterium]